MRKVGGACEYLCQGRGCRTRQECLGACRRDALLSAGLARAARGGGGVGRRIAATRRGRGRVLRRLRLRLGRRRALPRGGWGRRRP